MPSVTLATLQQYVIDRIDNNTVMFTVPEITQFINEAYQVTNIFCGINQASVSVPGFSVAGQLLYQVPDPIIFPLQCSFEGRPLRKLSLSALAQNYRQWAYDNTTKSGPVQRWSPIGINQFVIHPCDSLGGRDISLIGVVEPPLLVNPTDVISLDDEFIDMIVSYATHRVQLKIGGGMFSQASLLIQSYWHRLKERMIYQDYIFPRYFVLKGTTQA